MEEQIKEIMKITSDNPDKVKPEDRRFLISDSSSRINHDDQMLMNNQTRLFAIVAIIIAIASLIISLNLNKESKILFVGLLITLTTYLICHTFNFKRNFKKDRKEWTNVRGKILNHHFNYLKD